MVRIAIFTRFLTKAETIHSSSKYYVNGGSKGFLKPDLEEKNSPKAKQVVMTAGKPSGIAATAKATAILK